MMRKTSLLLEILIFYDLELLRDHEPKVHNYCHYCLSSGHVINNNNDNIRDLIKVLNDLKCQFLKTVSDIFLVVDADVPRGKL